MKMKLATPVDIFQIAQIFFDVYQGLYSDPLMKDLSAILGFIQSNEGFWFVTKNDENKVVASVLTRYDQENLFAKAFGAVVRNEYRAQGLMENLLAYAINYLKENTAGVHIVYSTTRTVNEAAQTLTEKLGFKKLGIFPNAHKTNEYETHCLTAIISPEALKIRKTNYKIHHQIEELYKIVASEVGLPVMESIVPEKPSKLLLDPQELEVINSPKFVEYRYSYLKEAKELEFEFFPFHSPNLVILSPDQSIELFCHLSTDGHCVIIGGKMPSNLNFTELFLKSNRLLRDAGARYVEAIVRADRPKILESLMKAKFICCGFFPAFQKVGDQRFDFVTLSRSYEIFDFQNVKLKGVNLAYLDQYYKAWKRTSLTPKLMET